MESPDRLTPKDWADCVNLLNNTLGSEMPVERMESYRKLLKDLPVKAVKSAVAKILMENQYLGPNRYPTVAEIRSVATALSIGVVATPEQAFERAMASVKRYGLDQPDKAHEMCGEQVWSCIKMSGGFERFCDCTSADKSALLAQFLDAWQRNVTAEHSRKSLPESMRPETVGLSKIDGKIEQKIVKEQLEKLANNVTLPLLEGESVSEREGVSKWFHKSEIDSNLPVDPRPGDDISRGYYISVRHRGETVYRLKSAQSVKLLMQCAPQLTPGIVAAYSGESNV